MNYAYHIKIKVCSVPRTNMLKSKNHVLRLFMITYLMYLYINFVIDY